MSKILKTLVISLLAIPSLFVCYSLILDQVNKQYRYGDLIDVVLIEKGTSDGVSGGFENYYEFTFKNNAHPKYNEIMTSTIQMDEKGNQLGKFILGSAINDTVVLKTYNKNCGKVIEWKDKNIAIEKPFALIIILLELLFWGLISFFCIRALVRLWY